MPSTRLVSSFVLLNRADEDFDRAIDCSAVVYTEAGRHYVERFASSTPLTPSEMQIAVDRLIGVYDSAESAENAALAAILLASGALDAQPAGMTRDLTPMHSDEPHASRLRAYCRAPVLDLDLPPRLDSRA